MSHLSGLALSIRSAVESETFDLAGQNGSSISNTITAAFTDPFPLKGTMIRITLITGAGKLARQKYDDGAAKIVTSTLRKLGYEDDSSASCVPQCAGSFKLQHDTGKNLKTVVIFPKILSMDKDESLEQGVSGIDLDNSNALLPDGSTEHTCAILSLEPFQKLIQTKCTSWSQKRECLHTLTNIVQTLKSIEAKLLNGDVLTNDEQDYYDTLSLDLLQMKEAYLKKEMSNHVDSGKITSHEKHKLLQQVDEKIDHIKNEISNSSDKPKKLQNLNNTSEKLNARRKMLYDITPIHPHKLKHEKDIVKLRKEMLPLLRLENSIKGRLLTLKETTALARKDEILEEIQDLENDSREWFEDDDVFLHRLKYNREVIKSKEKEVQKKVSKSSKTSSQSGFKVKGSGWGTVGSKPKSSQVRKPSAAKSGSVFSSMLMDSDSD